MSDNNTSENGNDQLIMVCGESGTGKSASLQNIRDQGHWLYLNAEAGKRLPFRNKFQQFKITDPYQVYEAMDHSHENPEVKGVVIDTATFLMDMYESQYVIGSANTQKAWGDYAQFWKNLLQQKVAVLNIPVVILAHTRADYDETSMSMRTAVPVKGSLKNQGLEAYFSTIVSTKKESIKDLKEYSNDMLHITDDDELVGYKHVFQTRITKKTIGERIRSPMGMFAPNETFIDNDVQILLDHLNGYYN